MSRMHHEPELTGCEKIRQFWLLRGDVINLLSSRHRIRFAVICGFTVGACGYEVIAGWNYCFMLK